MQYVLYLGTNDKDTDKPVFTQTEAKQKAKEIPISYFGGYMTSESMDAINKRASEQRKRI